MRGDFKNGLPDQDRMRALMTEMSRRVEEFDEKVKRLAEAYGVHGKETAVAEAGGAFLVTRATSNEKWGVYFRSDDDPESLKPVKACRIDVKVAFLKNASDVLDSYAAHIRQTHRMIAEVLGAAEE